MANGETNVERIRRERAAAARAAAAERAAKQGESYRPPTPSSGSAARGGNYIQRAPTAGTTIGAGNLPERMGQAVNSGNLEKLLLNSGRETPYATPAAPAGPGGGGGGGGGYSAQDQAAKTAQGLAALLASGQFGDRDTSGETGRLAAATATDQASRQSAYDRLAGSIGAQKDPYADVELTKARLVQPDYADLLSRLGGDSAAYKAEIGLANTTAAQGEDADQRFIRALSAGQSERRAQALLANEQSSEFGRSEIEAAGTQAREAMLERARQENAATQAQQMQIILQLIQANAAAGNDTDLSQFGLG